MKSCIEIDNNRLIIKNAPTGILTKSDLEAEEHPSYWEKGIEEVILEDGIETIYARAFCKFPNIKKVTCPKTLKKIEEKAFYSIMGNNEFEIDLNEGLECVGYEAFLNKHIKNIYIPSTVKHIGELAFSLGPKTEEIKISKDNPYYSDMDSNIIYDKRNNTLLRGCPNSKIPKETQVIDKYAFACCETPSRIEFPNSLKEIREAAFLCCKELEEIKLNQGIELIGKNVFDGASITKINELPSSLMSVYGSSLANLAIKEIIINCDLEKLEFPFFIGCDSLKDIYVRSINKDSKFYKQFENKIKPLNLDMLIESGKTFSEANKIFKDITR